MAIFNSYVTNYQRVMGLLNPYGNGTKLILARLGVYSHPLTSYDLGYRLGARVLTHSQDGAPQ
jgi:hypothetical protein